MVARKADADEIRAFLDSLAKRDWIKGSERRNWPRFLYHYTDISNVPAILRDGCLYSRSEAERRGILSTSSGDPGILSGTDAIVRDCVRLYFRPLTPTQFYAEGIRSQDALTQSRYPEAHCPVPVFFLFDAADVLTRADSRFAEGNLRHLGGGGVQLCSTAAELVRFPWDKIYHNTGHSPSERDIPFHKNAEVVVPKRLSLDALRYIFCRSQAEKDTLRALLAPDIWQKHQHKVLATLSTNLYFRRHTYVITADLFADRCSFVFSPDTESPGPFALKVDLDDGDRSYRYARSTYHIARDDPQLRLKLPRELAHYAAHLYLDEHLAYAGEYDEIPF